MNRRHLVTEFLPFVAAAAAVLQQVCILSALCDNGDALFDLKVGERFTCDFSAARFRALQALLVAEPDWVPPKGAIICADWCNQ